MARTWPSLGYTSCWIYESSHDTFWSLISKETLASISLWVGSIVYCFFDWFDSPLRSFGGSGMKMHYLGLLQWWGAGFYSLPIVHFNNSSWMAGVYCLDMFLS